MKGFTLVELLSVIVLVGIMVLIAVPTVNEMIQDAKEKNYNLQINQIESAAQAWASDNLTSIGDNELVTITLSQLKMSGIISKNIKNPLTNEYLANDMEILITKNNKLFNVDVLDETGTDKTPFNENSLVITLYGKYFENVEINESYTDPGVIFKDVDGNVVSYATSIKKDGVTVSLVDTSLLGVYEITYTATNNSVTSKVVRKITVADTTPPIITFDGPIEILTTDLVNLDTILNANINVTDNSQDTLEYDLSGFVDNGVGSYVVKYIAVDNSGNKTEKSRVVDVVSQFKYRDASGASIPKLDKYMIPVKYVGTDVVIADVYSAWYNYSNKEWANAVLINAEKRGIYLNAPVGTVIDKNDINSYLVWIPRFKYKLFNVNNNLTSYATIDISFTKPSDALATGTTNGSYLSHPAFSVDGVEVSGFWIGKFETTGTSSAPSILPGLSSIVSQSLSDSYLTAQMFNGAYTNLSNIYFDAHLIKNTEWGAVAYLSASIYGKNAQVVNNATTITGGGAGDLFITNITQSTSGNVYGVYDMAGTRAEKVMGGIYENGTSNLLLRSSMFTADINSALNRKYIDKYAFSFYTNDYARSKFGDALGETRNWHSGSQTMPESSYPFIIRGNGSLFSFNSSTGSASSTTTFRLVITAY